MPPARQLKVHVLKYPGIQVPALSGIADVFPFPVQFNVVATELSDFGLDSHGAVTHTQLSQDLRDYLATVPAPTNGDPWLACVIVAKRLMGEPSVNGVLIDADDSLGAQGYQRAGCAVFVAKTGSDWLFRRTLVHELGHVLNLDHADADPGCVMQSSPGQLSEQIRFTTIPAQHLTAHDPEEVRPNGVVFGRVLHNSHPQRDGSIYSGSSFAVRMSLRGSIQRRKGIVRYIIGTPPIVRTVARNLALRRNFALECSARRKLRVWLQCRRPHKAWQQLPPLRVACHDTRLVLRPGQYTARTIVLPQRYGMLIQPGLFELRTVVHLGGKPYVSASQTMEALPPPNKSSAALAKRLTDPSVTRAIERGYVSPSQQTRLARLTGTLPRRHPQRALLMLALGRSAAEKALARESAPVATQARRWLRQAGRSGDRTVRATAARWLKRLDKPHLTRRRPSLRTARATEPSSSPTRSRQRARRKD